MIVATTAHAQTEVKWCNTIYPPLISPMLCPNLGQISRKHREFSSLKNQYFWIPPLSWDTPTPVVCVELCRSNSVWGGVGVGLNTKYNGILHDITTVTLTLEASSLHAIRAVSALSPENFCSSSWPTRNKKSRICTIIITQSLVLYKNIIIAYFFLQK